MPTTPSHVAQRVDFSEVRYANCWEDADILCDALAPSEGKRVLSIGSAGDNALALLAGGAEVVAADLSPAQLACIELRRAAFAQLDYEPLLRFLGVRASDDRLAVYDAIRTALPPDDRAYWDANRDVIQRGVIHGGKFERYFHLFRRRVLPCVHSRRRVEDLVQPRDQAAREEFYNAKWDTWRWRAVFKIFFSRFVMGRLGRDPEFFRYVEGSVGDRILDRARYALTKLATHDNPYLDYILFGGFRDSVPPYLRSENYERIRGGLDRLTLFRGTVEEAAEALGDGGFDGYNLSDIFEYLSPGQCESVYRALLGRARPGARFAYWNMLAPRQRPDALAGSLQPLDELAAELFARDKAFFYSRFIVEEAT